MKKITDLTPEILEKIKNLAYDQLIEKYELYGYAYLMIHFKPIIPSY